MPVAGGDEPPARIVELSASLARRVRAIPKGVVLGREPFELRARIGAAPSEVLVLLPAGVRAVKRPRFPIAPLERLRAKGLPIRYVVLGPIVEAEEAAALERELARRSWCSRLEVRPGQVAAALAACDLILNCSDAEGFSNALAEALACGRAVLASDVPGNRAAVGTTGVLYEPGSEAVFEAAAERLLREGALRLQIGEAARRSAALRFDPGHEIDALLAAYEAARAASSPCRFRGRVLPLVAQKETWR